MEITKENIKNFIRDLRESERKCQELYTKAFGMANAEETPVNSLERMCTSYMVEVIQTLGATADSLEVLKEQMGK